MRLHPSSDLEVFLTEALLLRAPFDDGMPVERHCIGCHARERAAVRRAQARDVRDELEAKNRYRVLLVEISSHRLGHGYGNSLRRVWLTPAGAVLEHHDLVYDLEPWEGREPSECKWQVGDVVACVHGGRYRVGVVLALPPAPTARGVRRRANLTGGDDVYVVGLPGTALDGTALDGTALDGMELEQCRPRQAQMFSPVAPIQGALRSRLAALSVAARRGDR